MTLILSNNNNNKTLLAYFGLKYRKFRITICIVTSLSFTHPQVPLNPHDRRQKYEFRKTDQV